MLDPRIPAKLKVGGLWYTVVETPNMRADDHAMGTVTYGTLTIRIDPSAAGDSQCKTFLHELVHAISYGMGLGLSEPTVDRLAFALMAVLTDNRLHFDEVPADGN